MSEFNKERRFNAAYHAYVDIYESCSTDALRAALIAADAVDNRIFLSTEASDKLNADAAKTMGDLFSHGVAAVEVRHIGMDEFFDRSIREKWGHVAEAIEEGDNIHREMFGLSPGLERITDIKNLNFTMRHIDLARKRRKWYHFAMLRQILKPLTNFIRKVIIMATLADNVIALTAAVAALDAKVSALPTTESGTVDLSSVTTAIADVKADTAAILTEVRPSA